MSKRGWLPRSSVPSDRVAVIDDLEAAGKLVEAVDVLAVLNRERRGAEFEVRLVDLRARAAAGWEPGGGRTPWPPAYADPFPELKGSIPEIDRSLLNEKTMGGAVAHHGALLVRGLLDAEPVDRCRTAIDQIHELREAQTPARPRADAERWLRPMPLFPRPFDPVLRENGSEQGGTWLADSPAVAAFVLDDLADAGVLQIIAGHFGERPFFSLQKSTLRRTLPVFNRVAWHQDGAFLSEGVRTMNVWVALSRCGGDLPTPSLEVIPRRFDSVLPAEGRLIVHSVANTLVEELAVETPTIRPEFMPGDAILFDERFLHRTYLAPEMTDIRYALECWFFAPSHQTADYTPLLA
ncbi:MAG: phytanoyl-CoA dioxygenase family protein [Acidimicrobiales bacterium]